jgi:hypothetical protein
VSEDKPTEKQENSTSPSYSIQDKLREVKEVLGDRMIIGDIPNYQNKETQTRGVKL